MKGTYSEKKYFAFFAEVLKDYTGSKCLYKHTESHLIVTYMPHNKISLCIVKYDSDSRIRYDSGSKNIFLCNG